MAVLALFLQPRNGYIASDDFPEMTTLQVDGRPTVAVTFDPTVLLKFLKQDFTPMNMMCERAEMFEERIYDRSKAIFEYYGLPFKG